MRPRQLTHAASRRSAQRLIGAALYQVMCDMRTPGISDTAYFEDRLMTVSAGGLLLRGGFAVFRSDLAIDGCGVPIAGRFDAVSGADVGFGCGGSVSRLGSLVPQAGALVTLGSEIIPHSSQK